MLLLLSRARPTRLLDKNPLASPSMCRNVLRDVRMWRKSLPAWSTHHPKLGAMLLAQQCSASPSPYLIPPWIASARLEGRQTRRRQPPLLRPLPGTRPAAGSSAGPRGRRRGRAKVRATRWQTRSPLRTRPPPGQVCGNRQQCAARTAGRWRRGGGGSSVGEQGLGMGGGTQSGG